MEEVEEAQDEEWHSDARALYTPEPSRSYAFTAAITLLIAAYANRSLTGTDIISFANVIEKNWHACRPQTNTRREITFESFFPFTRSL